MKKNSEWQLLAQKVWILLQGFIQPIATRQRMITLLNCNFRFLLFIVKCLNSITNWSKNILDKWNNWGDPIKQRRTILFINLIDTVHQKSKRQLYRSIMKVESLVGAIKDADKNGEYKIRAIEEKVIPLTNLANEIRSVWRG